MNKLLRRDLIFLLHVSREIILYFGSALLRLRDTNHRFVRRQLKKIPVSGNNPDLQAFFLRLLRRRTDQIICLISLQHHQRNAHIPKHLLHDGNLLPQLIRHRVTRSLVRLIFLMAEGRCTQIKCDSQILGLFFLQHLEQNVQKAVHRVRMHTGTAAQQRNPVICTIHNAMTVNQDYFLTHGRLLLASVLSDRYDSTASLCLLRLAGLCLLLLAGYRLCCLS